MTDWLVPGKRVLVTGGAGFIGGAVVRRLLRDSTAVVFNLDKLGYASDLTSIETLPQAVERHQLMRVDLVDAQATAAAVRQADPDLVLHLAAESHVDRSIAGPGAYGSTSSPDFAYIDSNVSGTFNLLQAVRAHWEQLPQQRQASFRFHHISTDEVFGSLGADGSFSETTPYDPRSPYSASKAASDHLVRDWLYVDDHVEALLLAAICGLMDQLRPAGAPHGRRHAIDATKISTELCWRPEHSFKQGLVATVRWMLDNLGWCQQVRQRAGYQGGRLGQL